LIKVAQILGLVGGIGGAILTSLIILIIRVRRVFERASSGERLAGGTFIWSYVIFILAMVGIVGAALVRSRPKAGGILMMISGGGGAVAVFSRIIFINRINGGDIIEGIFSLLLLAAGVLGLISSSRQMSRADTREKP
jgi:hypothetical protein